MTADDHALRARIMITLRTLETQGAERLASVLETSRAVGQAYLYAADWLREDLGLPPREDKP